MVEHGRIRAFSSAALAVIGGALMVGGGVVNHSFLVSLLNIVGGRVGTVFSGVSGFILLLAISIVSMLVGLGGFTVAIGGILILKRHLTTGRLLIALGGGTGFIGLLVSFGYTAATTGFGVAVIHSIYWVGLVMAIAARRVAKHA